MSLEDAHGICSSNVELFMFSLILCVRNKITRGRHGRHGYYFHAWSQMSLDFQKVRKSSSKVEIYRTSPFIELHHIKLHHS
jgi:hypothetical protein